MIRCKSFCLCFVSSGVRKVRSTTDSSEEPLSGPSTSHHFIATSGSDYYFPPDRHAKKTNESKVEDERSTVVIRGAGRHVTISAVKPPLTLEEIEHWKLDRLIVVRPLLFELDKEPKFLLPPKERVYSLGPEMDKIDELYRRKGRYTPSEVAQAFFNVIPSFFVELRHVFQALPPSLAYRMEQDMGPRGMGANFFGGYPMLFRQRRPTHQKSAVKLNTDFWFVKAHPFFRKADRFQYKNNSDYKAHIGGVVHKHAPAGTGSTSTNSKDIDLKIFDILARHIVSADGSEKTAEDLYQPKSLIQWMNSLKPEDMAVIQQVPEQRIVLILSKYVRVFQLLCGHAEDQLLYTDKSNLEAHFPTTSAVEDEDEMDDFKEAEEPTSSTYFVQEGSSSAADPDEEAETEASESDPPTSDSSNPTLEAENLENVQRTEQREPSAPIPRVLHQLDEDLLGLEDILTGDPSSPEPSTEGSFPTASSPATPAVTAVTPECVDDMNLPSKLDIVLVRRLPPYLAPRSLSNFNAKHTPLPDITEWAASFLGPPPSLRKVVNYFTTARIKHRRHTASLEGEVWRWVPIRLIYDSLEKTQRRELRRFRGLTNYLRLHGELFEVSTDFMHVIAHDKNGTVTPFLPQQKTFSFEERVVLPDAVQLGKVGGAATMVGEKERKLFNDILGDSQIPTTRKQIALLDPENPILQHEIFYEEVAKLLPPHPVRKREVLQRLPPIMRAAVPTRGAFNNNCSRHIAVFFQAGEAMVQRKDVAEEHLAAIRNAPKPGEPPAMSAEAAIEEVRQHMPDGGATVRALRKMYAPTPAVSAVIQHFGSFIKGLESFPQYFIVERREGMQASDSFVRLR